MAKKRTAAVEPLEPLEPLEPPEPLALDLVGEWVAPAVLVPWSGNPRLNDGEPTDRVADSIRAFGFAAPIVARRSTNEIIAGHTRWKAAIKLGLERVPVRYMDLDERQARLLALADNRLGELANWDDAQLSELLSGYDDAEALLAGWTADDLDELQAQLGEVDPDAVGGDGEDDEAEPGAPTFDLYSRERLAEELILVLHGKRQGDFAPAVPDVMVALNRCTAGRHGAALSRCTDRWFPHRYDTLAGKARCTPNEQLQSVDMIRAAAGMSTGVMKRSGTVREFLNDILLAYGGQCARQFPIARARDIYREFTHSGDAVLDPCAGWGGRLLGWLCARQGGRYEGFDAGKATADGFARMIAELGIEHARVTHAAFEDVVLEPESFDFAFTSPPYYTLEHYSTDAEQAEQRYATYPVWVEGFFTPLITHTLAALRPGCAFVMNVSDAGDHALAQDAEQIARDAGAEVERRSILIGAERSMRGRESSDVEDLLVLRKPGRQRRHGGDRG